MEKAKKIRSIVAGCLAAVTLTTAGLAVATDGFKSFRKNDNIQMELPEENNGGAVVGESTGNGVKLMSTKIAKEDYAANGISPLAETAYTLTPTVTPEYEHLTFVWSVEFVNPSSEWATGKTVTDYVTVTPSLPIGSTAAVECKQDFGSQIKVIVKVAGNETAKAECTVDYRKAVKSVPLNLSGIAFDTNSDFVLLNKSLSDTFTFSSGPAVYSDYTIDVEYPSYDPVCYVFLTESEKLAEAEEFLGGELSISLCFYDGVANGPITWQLLFDEAPPSGDILNKLINWLREQENCYLFDFLCDFDSYNILARIPIYFAPEALSPQVDNIELDHENIIF